MRDTVLPSVPRDGDPFSGMLPADLHPEGTRPAGTLHQHAQHLRAVVDRLQYASDGDAELDALIEAAFQALYGALDTSAVSLGDNPFPGLPAARSAHWSTDLSAAIGLLSPAYNFSVGRRDGICWAWIQPNDDWQPGEFQARHDHPAGSGLIAAYTAALALMSAILLIYAARLESADCR